MGSDGLMDKERFYNGAKWRKASAAALSRANYMDQVQRRFGKMVEADMTHHALPLEDFPQYAYHPHNLIAVNRIRTHSKLHNEDGSLTAAGVELARRTARKIGIDVEGFLAAQKVTGRNRPDHGRYTR